MGAIHHQASRLAEHTARFYRYLPRHGYLPKIRAAGSQDTYLAADIYPKLKPHHEYTMYIYPKTATSLEIYLATNIYTKLRLQAVKITNQQ